MLPFKDLPEEEMDGSFFGAKIYSLRVGQPVEIYKVGESYALDYSYKLKDWWIIVKRGCIAGVSDKKETPLYFEKGRFYKE